MATTQNGNRGARKGAPSKAGATGGAAKKGATKTGRPRASADSSAEADGRGRKATAARGADRAAAGSTTRGGARKGVGGASDGGTGRGAGAKKAAAGAAAAKGGGARKGASKKAAAQKSGARKGAVSQASSARQGAAQKGVARKGAAASGSASRKSGAAGARKSPARRGAARSTDALDLLKQDHERVEKLIKQFERLKKRDGDDVDKAEVAGQICVELTLHAQLEEELFYPALRERLGDDEDLVDEAQVEHDSAKSLMAQIQLATPGDPKFDALVTVLGEYVRHHVEEEETEIFRKAKRAKLDTAALGERIAQRKAALQGGVGGGEPGADDATGGGAASGNDAAAADGSESDGEPADGTQGGAGDTTQVSLDETHADQART